MKKFTLLALLLGFISTTSIAYDAVNSPYNENPVWLKKELNKQEFLEVGEYLMAVLGDAADDMLKIPTWNGRGSNEAFERYINLKEKYTCNFELANYEFLRFMKSQIPYHPDFQELQQRYKNQKKLFDELVSGKDPDTYTIQECKASDNWFPM